jgi:hypothetical protein
VLPGVNAASPDDTLAPAPAHTPPAHRAPDDRAQDRPIDASREILSLRNCCSVHGGRTTIAKRASHPSYRHAGVLR